MTIVYDSQFNWLLVNDASIENIQKDFSLKVGVSRQTIVAIEKGQYSPTLELCFKLALVFDKPIDDIFYTDSKEKKE